MAEKYDIFISYRREGGFETAKHIYDLMSNDGYQVSFDIDTLRNGDFDTELLRRIDQCTDFVLILNKGVFDRCFDSSIKKENDWLRNELAYALQKGKNIIPIMLEGFTEFPENLPDDIFRVSRKNGPKYDKYYFDEFYQRLKKFLDTPPPAPRNVAAETIAVAKGAKIYVRTDMDCRILKYDEEIGKVLTTDKGKFIRLLKGNHELEFVSLTNSAERYSMIYRVESNDMEDILSIELFSAREKKMKRILATPNEDIAAYKEVNTSKYGYKIKSTGEIIITPKYTFANPFCYGWARVGKSGKFGFIDKLGREVTPIKYDNTSDFNGKVALVELNGKYGYIDQIGKEVVPIKYDALTFPKSFDDGASVKLNGKWGYTDKTGKEIIPAKYDESFVFNKEGTAKVKQGGEEFYVDKSGEEFTITDGIRISRLSREDIANYLSCL